MKEKIQFMIDIGAAVSLIREDSWKEAVDSQSVLMNRKRKKSD